MVKNKIMEKWRQDLARDSARHGEGGNKLWSYRLFKREYKTENYLTCLLPGRHRSTYSKFRCGVAPLRLETGRYENLQIDERLCHFCSDQSIENETHVLLKCPLYSDLRQNMFSDILRSYANFSTLDEQAKFKVILNSEHSDVIRICAKTCCDILDRRRTFLYR